MTHTDYKEMLALHALGALDASETRVLESHLVTCAACRAELAEWLDTAATLAYAAPLVEPPAALRSRLLESIRVPNTETAPSRELKRRSASVEVPAQSQSSSVATNVIPMPERPRQRLRAWQRFGALAASVAFAAFIITLIVLWNRNQAMQAELARLNGDLQTTQKQLQSARDKIEMLTAPDANFATLTGTEMSPQARALLAYNKSGSAMLIADGLPQAPAGKDYQIWFIADGKPMPGRVFKPDAAGHIEMQDQIPAAARSSAAAFVITLEPQGGMPAPTGQKYLLSAASS